MSLYTFSIVPVVLSLIEILTPVFLYLFSYTTWPTNELVFQKDYVDSMDELLQPLVDEAKLVGYSCRREWISTMVSSLTTYLAKEIFPSYSSQVDEERVTGIQSSAIVSWLHLIDLMIAFDKRIKSLVDHSGITSLLWFLMPFFPI